MDGNVNDVFHVYDANRNIAGYYKSGRNGNIQSGYMENGIYEISIQFGVEKYFAPTKLKKASPRTLQQLNIGKSLRSSTLADISDNTPLEITFQKKLEGIELRYIQVERKIKLLEDFVEFYQEFLLKNFLHFTNNGGKL